MNLYRHFWGSIKLTIMKIKHLSNIPRIIYILIISAGISFYLTGCSLIKNTHKKTDPVKSEKSNKKKNSRSKPPIKRNLLE